MAFLSRRGRGRLMAWAGAVLIGGALLAASCFNPNQPPCAFSCATDGVCPSGYTCGGDKFCHKDGATGVCALDDGGTGATSPNDAMSGGHDAGN